MEVERFKAIQSIKLSVTPTFQMKMMKFSKRNLEGEADLLTLEALFMRELRP